MDLSVKEQRRKERQEIYQTRRWRELRNLKIQNNPLCEECLKEGRITPAVQVHHIISFCKRGISEEEKIRRAYDYDNLMSLCVECHHKMHDTQSKLKEWMDKYK